MNSDVMASLARFATAANRPLIELRDVVTAEMCVLTRSKLSYIAAINLENDVLTMVGWSQSAMQACALDQRPVVYKVAETGLWGDAIREG